MLSLPYFNPNDGGQNKYDTVTLVNYIVFQTFSLPGGIDIFVEWILEF